MADEELREITCFFNDARSLVTKVQNRKENEHEDLCYEINIFVEGLYNFFNHPNISSSCKFSIQNSIDDLLILLQEVQRDDNFSYDQILSDVAVINYVPEKEFGKKGRPKFVISQEVLLFFRDLGFKWKEISSMLGVSRWTVSRRVEELGLKDVTGYSNISDDELERIIRDVKTNHGCFVGRSMILGHLRSLGLKIQERRVADMLRIIDPENSHLRWSTLVHRRKYSVPGPNSLWHIDGHHSLINWKFVIHGGIDGYSRLIVYLHCSSNNKKETVSALFDKATDQWGFPSRVRSDKGGENQLVWVQMEAVRGENRGSFLASSSVHNQRIERLWRDVWTYVCHQFYYTFQAMENQGKNKI